MALRGGGCFTPAALLLMVGLLLILWGSMAEAPRPVGYGVGCLAAAGLLAAAAAYVRWQGWG